MEKEPEKFPEEVFILMVDISNNSVLHEKQRKKQK